jgi:uncharacterized phage protein gp47/JayE
VADAPTQNDLFLVGRAEAVLSPTRFDRAIIDTVGSDVNTVFNVSAAMGEEVVRYFQVALNELSLATARGEALDRVVFDRYQLTRREATNAVVTLSLTRTNDIGFTIPAGSVFGTRDGINFITANDVAFGAGVLGPLTVIATADQTGPDGNVAAETVTEVLSALEDSTTAVTNAETAAGGNARETDDEFRARARDFFVTARRGTREAIEFGALQVGGVEQANAIETLQSTESGGLPGFRVQLNIADSEGQANTALSQEVARSLDEYRALGVPVSVVAAVPQLVDISASGLQFEVGANTTAVLQQAANAVLASVNGLAPGAVLRRSELIRVLQNVDQLIVPDGSLTQPAGDLVPSTGTVIRTTRDRVDLSG